MQTDIEQLRERASWLEKENQRLRDELEKYRFQMKLSDQKVLTNEEKFSIYNSYFAGRQDVVAKRYYSKKNGKYGYSPICTNDFKQSLCLKCVGKKINCIKCTSRNFVSMSNELLLNHFRGNKSNEYDVCLGIYPLLKNGTCNFLAIDFDDYDWLEEMKSVYHTAHRLELHPLLERSQSGRGGHLWIFFAEPIKATKARKIGFILLKETMKENNKIKFDSFDRMFPNQDYISNDGLGNLIALPLQSTAFQKGNSSFINENGECISNPIAYLVMIKKSTEYEINRIIQSNEEVDYFFDDDQLSIPLYADTKYNSQLYLLKSKMLYIKKESLNSLTLNMIRRLASMYNPDYFLLQRLHKPMYNVPLTLGEYNENEHYIAIPRGCIDKLKKVFIGTDIEIDDKTIVGEKLNLTFIGELNEQQKIAVKSLLNYEQGVLQATAGFGKTVMSLKIISEINCNTLIIVNTKKLLDQWMKQIEKFLAIPKYQKKSDSFVGQFTGMKKNLKYNLDIATASALAKNEELEKLLMPYGMVIIDECHHIPSSSFRLIMKNVQSKYIYGLSATPDRQDGLEKIIYMYCGMKRFETNKKYIISQREFRQVLIPHFTNVYCFESDLSYQELIEEIAENDNRNFMITKDIITSFRQGRKIIALSERISHLKILFEKVRDVSSNIFLYTGDLSQKDKKILENAISNLDENENFIILATSKLLGEGFDLPSLDTLFLTLPIADKNRIEQYTGRLHRQYANKTDVQVHDYIDIHLPVFEAMFQKRLKAYYNEGYHLQEVEKTQSLTSLLYYKDTYFKVFERDLLEVRKYIVIRMRLYQIMKVKKLHELLMQTTRRGVKVTVIVDEISANNEVQLYFKGAGCVLKSTSKPVKSNFMIFDKDIVWYGDLNIFNQESNKASFVRLQNNSLAQELLRDI